MARAKSKAELEQQIRDLRTGRAIDLAGGIIAALIRWGGLAVIAYFVNDTIKVLAGKTTFADIGIRLIGDLRVSEMAAYVFGVGGIGYGWRQRKLRRDAIQHLHPRAREREEVTDPRRSSSRLTPRGGTRPEDQP